MEKMGKPRRVEHEKWRSLVTGKIIVKVFELVKKGFTEEDPLTLPLVMDKEILADAQRIGFDANGFIPEDPFGPDTEFDAEWARAFRAVYSKDHRLRDR